MWRLASQFPGEDGRIVSPRVDAELEDHIAAAVGGQHETEPVRI